MKLSDKINGGLYGAILIIVSNLIVQADWGMTLSVASLFAIGGLVWRPFLTFMSEDKKQY